MAHSFGGMTTHIETERLILREWNDGDLEPFSRINADPMVMQYLPRSLDKDASDKLARRFQKHFDKRGYGLYVVEVKDSKEFAGFVGLNDVAFKASFTPATEIAWRLDYGYWGQGYASEAAAAVLGHAHGPLGLKDIVSFTVHDNTRSTHLMEKIGLRHDHNGDFDYPTLRKGHPLGRFVLYRSV